MAACYRFNSSPVYSGNCLSNLHDTTLANQRFGRETYASWWQSAAQLGHHC